MLKLLSSILKPFNLPDEYIKLIDSEVFLRGNLIRSCIEAEFCFDMHLIDVIDNFGWEGVFNSASYAAPYPNVLPDTPLYIEQVSDDHAIHLRMTNGMLTRFDVNMNCPDTKDPKNYVEIYTYALAEKTFGSAYGYRMQYLRSVVSALGCNSHFSFYDHESWDLMKEGNFIDNLLRRKNIVADSTGRYTATEAYANFENPLYLGARVAFAKREGKNPIALYDRSLQVLGVDATDDIAFVAIEALSPRLGIRMMWDDEILGAKLDSKSFRYSYLKSLNITDVFVKHLMVEFNDWRDTLETKPLDDVIASVFFCDMTRGSLIQNRPGTSIPVSWYTNKTEVHDVQFIHIGDEHLHPISIITGISIENGVATGQMTLNADVVPLVGLNSFTIRDIDDYLVICNCFGAPLGR